MYISVSKIVGYVLLIGLYLPLLGVSINGQSNGDFAQENLSCTPVNATAAVSTKGSTPPSLTTELAAMCVSGAVGIVMFRLPYMKDLYNKRILNTPVTQGKIAEIIVNSIAQVALRKDLNKEQPIKVIIKDSAYYICNNIAEDIKNFIFSDKILKELLISSKACFDLQSAEIEIQNKPLLKFAADTLNKLWYLRTAYMIYGLRFLGKQSNKVNNQSTQDRSEETPDRGKISQENHIAEHGGQSN
jgi:hypothetical protein